jgi:protein-tyrosine-phosphatase/DNA-binding transcriptional ArsR family regulator
MDDIALARGLAALGQEFRLALLRALLEVGDRGLSAGNLADRLRVAPSSLSFHLRILEQSGLVSQERDGRSLVYRLESGPLHALIDGLAGFAGPRAAGAAARPDARFNVLFVCTRNSARSIMAEAILDAIAGGRFAAWSAGSDPSPSGPMPEVVQHLKALGHDVSRLRSKSWSAFTGSDAPRLDFVIALCDTLQGQVCPDFGPATMTAAWPLPDPAKFTGSLAERATLLNELYAMLRRRLEIFVSLPHATLDRMALKARIDELAQPLVAAATPGRGNAR